jgi:hypothetical protein
MDKFDAPGFLQDFDAAQHDAWSEMDIDAIRRGAPTQRSWGCQLRSAAAVL